MSGCRSGGNRGGVIRLLAVAALVAGCAGDAPDGTPTSTTQALAESATPAASAPSPSPTASATQSAAPTPTPAGWTVAETPSMAGGENGMRRIAGPPMAIAVGASGAVIVGERFIADPSPDAAATAFRSEDLATWRPSVLDAGLSLGTSVPTSGPLVGMSSVTWGSAGFVAAGIDLTPGVTGVAWRSADGRRWTRHELPGAATARPSAVAWNGGRYVAVGVDEGPRSPRMAVWTSVDGISWRRVADGAAFDVGDYQDTMQYHGWAGPADVDAAGPAGFVAVGRRCVGGRTYGEPIVCTAVVWRSPDGWGWTAERSPDPLRGSVVAGAVLAAGDASRVVLVGATADADGNREGGRVVIAGADAMGGVTGPTWEVVTPDGLPELGGIAVLDGVLYAVGLPLPQPVDPSPAVQLWRSSDGRIWERVAGLPGLPADVMSVRGMSLAVAGERLAILVSVVLEGEPPFGGIVLVGAPARP